MFIYDLTIFSFLLLIDREWVHSILNFIYISITLFDVLKFIFYLSNAQHASFGFNKSLSIYVHVTWEGYLVASLCTMKNYQRFLYPLFSTQILFLFKWYNVHYLKSWKVSIYCLLDFMLFWPGNGPRQCPPSYLSSSSFHKGYIEIV